MVSESSVLVRLRLLGGQAFARTAAKDAESLSLMGKSATVASAKLKGVGAAMGTAGAGLAAGARALKRIAMPLAAIGAVSGKMAMDFEQAMTLIHTQTGASRAEVKQLSGEVLNLARTAKQGPTELANALYRIEGAGIRGKNAMKALKASSDLAAVGNANVEDTAKTLSQVWFSGIKGASNFKNVVAEMNATVGAGDLRLQQLVDALGVGIMPVARNAGLTMRDVTGALALFGDETNNVSGWTAQLATALHFLYQPTAKAETALESIGLSGTKLGTAMHGKQGLLTALKMLRSHLGKLKGGMRGVKGAQVLGNILPGGRGRVLNVMLGQLDRYEAKMKQVGGTTSRFGEAVATTQQTAAFKVHHAWAMIQVAMVKLGSHIMPIAASAFVAVAGSIDKLSGAMDRLGNSGVGKGVGKGVQDLVTGVQNAVKGPKSAPKLQHMSPRRRFAVAKTRQTADKTGTAAPSAMQKIGGLVVQQAKKIGAAAMDAGRQLLAAFKPAMPFLQNVLLPLLAGVAAGVIAGVVTTFKLAIPVITIFAKALGFIGTIAKPLKPVFFGIGTVLGFIFGGPILDALSLLPKVGLAFRLVALPARFLSGAFKIVFGVARRLVGIFLRVHLGVLRFVGTFASSPARVTRAALNIVGGVIHTMSTMPGRLLALGGRIVGGLVRGVRSKLPVVTSFFGRVGGAIVRAIVNEIKHAPGQIISAISSIIPDKLKGAARKVLGVAGLASGGTVKRGGLAVVGERGPELADLPGGTTVYSNRTSRRAGATMATPPPMTLVANLHLDGKQIHQAVFKVDRSLAEVG